MILQEFAVTELSLLGRTPCSSEFGHSSVEKVGFWILAFIPRPFPNLVMISSGRGFAADPGIPSHPQQGGHLWEVQTLEFKR